MADEQIHISLTEKELSGNRLIGVNQFLSAHENLRQYEPQLIEYAKLRPEEKLRSKQYVHISADRRRLISLDKQPPADWNTERTEEEEISVFPELDDIVGDIEKHGFDPYLRIAKVCCKSKSASYYAEQGYFWKDLKPSYADPQINDFKAKFDIRSLADYAEILGFEDFSEFLDKKLIYYNRAGINTESDIAIIDYFIRNNLPLIPSLHQQYKGAEDKVAFIKNLTERAKNYAKRIGVNYEKDPKLVIADMVINRTETPGIEKPAQTIEEIKHGGFLYHLTSQTLAERVIKKGLRKPKHTGVIATTATGQLTHRDKIYLGNDLVTCIHNAGVTAGRSEFSRDLVLLKVRVPNTEGLTVDEDWVRSASYFTQLAHAYANNEISEADLRVKIKTDFTKGLDLYISPENFEYMMQQIIAGSISPLSAEQGLRFFGTIAYQSDSKPLQIIEAIPFSVEYIENEVGGNVYIPAGYWKILRGEGLRKMVEEEANGCRIDTQNLTAETIQETSEINKKESVQDSVQKIRDMIGIENLPSIEDFKRPNGLWFERLDKESINGIHGISHMTRVAVWSQILGKMVLSGGQSVDTDVLKWVSAIHDAKRRDDNIDQDHGVRVASWFMEVADQIGAQHLTLVQKQLIANICQFDELNNFGPGKIPAEVNCFKDADILERVRIADLNPRFLRIDISPKLIPAAVALFDLSERYFAEGIDPFDAVMKAAVRLGLIKNSVYSLTVEESNIYNSTDIITY